MNKCKINKYKVVVSSIFGSYSGYEYGSSSQEVVEKLRNFYKRNKDSRANWNIRAKRVREN